MYFSREGEIEHTVRSITGRRKTVGPVMFFKRRPIIQRFLGQSQNIPIIRSQQGKEFIERINEHSVLEHDEHGLMTIHKVRFGGLPNRTPLTPWRLIQNLYLCDATAEVTDMDRPGDGKIIPANLQFVFGSVEILHRMPMPTGPSWIDISHVRYHPNGLFAASFTRDTTFRVRGIGCI